MKGLAPASGLLVLVCLTACPEVPPASAENHAPIARLVVPQLVVTGSAVDVDAAGSVDEDGDALVFSFSFGDGSPEVDDDDDGTFAHAWLAPGTFSVGVAVRDPLELEASAEATIVVVNGVAEGCSCEAPCFPGGVCTDRGCLVFASSVPEDAAAFDDVVACE